MKRKPKGAQRNRVKEAIKLLGNYSTDPDCLFRLVATVGPSFFGLVIARNAVTVWARVENPQSFKYGEIKKVSQTFKISVVDFLEVIERQEAYNFKERIHRRPIGQKKYYPHKYDALEP